MTFYVQNNKLVGAQWVPTPHTFGWMNPTLAVVHETGTRITPGAAVKYCTAPKRINPIRVGYHIIIGRELVDGKALVTQLAKFDQKVRHAGISKWNGRQYCNSFSIGIGLVGPTELKGTEKRAKSYYGKWFTSEDGIVAANSSHHGKGHIWLPHTREQLDALDDVIFALKNQFPDIDVAGHYQVSPGRKIDPSPLINIQALGQVDPVNQDIPTTPAEPVAEVAKPPSTDKILKKQSREYRTADLVEKVVAGSTVVVSTKAAVDAVVPSAPAAPAVAVSAPPPVVVPPAPAVVAPEVTQSPIEFLTMIKTYMDLVSGMVAAYSVPLLIAAGFAIFAATYAIKHWKRQSYDNGLYEPSGEEAERAGQ